MKIDRLIMLTMLLLVMTMGSISAAENATQNDLVTSSDSTDILVAVEKNFAGNDKNLSEEDNTDFNTLKTSGTDLAGNSNEVSYDNKYYLFRGDCWIINNNFESSAVVTSDTINDLTVTGTFRTQNDFVGLYWNSKDPIEHPYISYGNRSDYRDVTLEFDYEMIGCRDFSNDAIIITIAANSGEIYYLTMNRYIDNGHVKLDFNNLTLLPGNSYFDKDGQPVIVKNETKLNVSDLKYIMFSLVPVDFKSSSPYTIINNTAFTCRIYNISVTNGEICNEQPKLEPHQYRLCEGYGNSYNLNPFRLSKEMRKLGYVEWVDLYIGASYYYEKRGVVGDIITDMNFDHNRTEKMVLDKNMPINNAFKAWLDCYSRELKNNGVKNLVISVSMENLQCPQSWRQMDSNGNFAMTGWSPSTFFLSPCNDEVIQYMRDVSEACLDIVVNNGLKPILQMGESWWWWDENYWTNQPPYFYDNATKSKYFLEYGTALPEYKDVRDEYNETVVQWLNQQLVKYSDALRQVVKSEKYADGIYMALFFTPTIIDPNRVPQMMMDANYIKDAYSPSKLDILQIEDYDWVIFENPHHSEAYTIGQELGFSEDCLHYFSGFVQYHEDADTYWPLIQKAMDDALEKDFKEAYVWAGSQVRRDYKILGYDEYVILQNLILSNEPGIVSPIITAPDNVNATENFTIKMHTDEWVSGVFNVYEYKNCEKGILLASNTITGGNSSVVISSFVGGLNKFYLEFDYTGGKYHLIQEVYVNNLETNLTSDDLNVEYDSDLDLVITLKDKNNIMLTDKTISVNLNGTNYTITTNSNGQASLPINLDCGNYTAIISFYEDDTYKSSDTSANIIINKIDSTLIVDDVNLKYEGSLDVNVKAQGATGITAKINDKDIQVNDFIIPISGLNAGNYTLTVTTIPDKNHISVNKTVKITVNKINSTLSLDNIKLDYGSSIDVNITAEGTVDITAKIDDNDTQVNGFVIPISGLNAGNYTLTVTTIPDKNHLSVNKTVAITVNKIDSTLNVSNVNMYYGTSVNVNVSAEGSVGITAKINDKDTQVNDFIIPISNLNAGNYTLTVTTIPDENHITVNRTVTITVRKVNSTLKVENVELDYGTSLDVNVTAEGAVGITAKINDKEVHVNDFIIPISGLNAGNYTLTVTTIPDENHISINKTTTITVNKIPSYLSVDNVELDYNTYLDVNVTAEGAVGITAMIDGKDTSVNEFVIPISGLNAGNYNLTVTIIPDDNHLSVNKTTTITVNKINSSLSVSDVTLDYGSSVKVNVSCDGTIGITAMIDNNTNEIIDYIIPISGLNAGNYTLTVTTIPDKNHISINKTTTITVNKVNSTLTLDNIELDYGTSLDVNVTAEGTTGITAKIGDESVNVIGYTIPISDLNAGNYTLTVTTIPDKNHISINKTTTITVNKINSNFSVRDVTLDYGSYVKVNVSCEGTIGITTMINNDKIEVNDYTIPISDLNAGNYNLTVTTIPDDNHLSINKTVKITVNKVNSTLTLDNIELDYGTSLDVNVTAEGTTGITAKIGDEPVNVIGYTIPISDLNAGNYSLTVTTIPDKNHISINKTTTITVNKIESSLSVDNVELDYKTSLDVNVTAEGAVGITARIDGKETHVNGFMIPISGLIAGNYNLTVTTIPDKNHNPFSKSVNITVNKLTTSLAANNITLKYSDDANLTITLKDEKDNLLADKNITIYLNGSNKTLTTSNNGQATLPINLLPDNYTAEIRFIGDTCYLPSETYSKIIINKLTTSLDADNLTVMYGDDANLTIILKDEKNNLLADKDITIFLNGSNKTLTTNSNGQVALQSICFRAIILPKSIIWEIMYMNHPMPKQLSLSIRFQLVY